MVDGKLLDLLLAVSGFLISGLLGINIFFVRAFMIRIETGLSSLTAAVADHSVRMAAFNEKVAQLDRNVSELHRKKRANGPVTSPQ